MDIVRHRVWFFGLSGLLILVSLVALAIQPSLKPGIDFTGGAALTVEFEEPVTAEQVRVVLNAQGHSNAIVQRETETRYFIRVGELRLEVRNDEGDIVDPGDRQILQAELSTISPAQITGLDSISGVIGGENVRNAIIAVIVASIAILFYVTWAFRRVPSPFRYGTAAIVALVHDVVIVLGTFSILGKVADLEVNAMFITGVLTIIGYSVNDTIVVFDRIRENVAKYNASSLNDLVNLSVRETIGRSINTSLTLLIVVIALMLFGGPSIFQLLLVLLVGVIVGTYSSIFTASLMLVAWENGEIGRLFGRLRLRRQPA